MRSIVLGTVENIQVVFPASPSTSVSLCGNNHTFESADACVFPTVSVPQFQSLPDGNQSFWLGSFTRAGFFHRGPSRWAVVLVRHLPFPGTHHGSSAPQPTHAALLAPLHGLHTSDPVSPGAGPVLGAWLRWTFVCRTWCKHVSFLSGTRS